MNKKTAAIAALATISATLGFVYLAYHEIGQATPFGVDTAQSSCGLSITNAFRTNPYGAINPFQNGSYYVLDFAHAITPPYTIAGADAISKKSCHIRLVQFDAKFLTNGNQALGSDDMVIFFANDVTSFKGQEFGVRFILNSGFVFGYVQDGPQYFTQIPLTPHDGELHRYSIKVSRNGTNDFFAWSVDGVVRGSLVHSSTFDYTKLVYWTVMTTHRVTNGWDSTGDYMQVGDFRIEE